MLIELDEILKYLEENVHTRVERDFDECGNLSGCDYWTEAFIQDVKVEFSKRHKFAGQPSYIEIARAEGRDQATHIRYEFDFSIGFQHNWKTIVNRMNEAFRQIVKQETGQKVSVDDFS
jgi:hypothetical protein